MRQVHLIGVRLTAGHGEAILLLADDSGDVVLPIVVGAGQGASIAAAQAGIVPPRPQTHDLMVSVIGTLGSSLIAVAITDLRDGVFHAVLVLTGGRRVDCRPSDAIALAVRVDCPIHCSQEVLDMAAQHPVPIEDAEVAEFREFLDRVDPEDFDQ